MSDARIESWTAGDGYSWKYRRYDPTGPTVGEIVALHGIQSHGGWYDASSQWLAEHGWAVSFLDRRGSGLNEGARGDCPSFRRLLDDIAEFMRPLRERVRCPVAVQGISWGGKLALALQKRHPGLCDGMVLVTPGFRPKVRPPLHVRLSVLCQRLVYPTRLLPIPLNDPELFTGNGKRQQFISDDPLAWRQATARFLLESRRLDFYCRRARRRINLPVLLLLAGQDRIVNNEKTRKYAKRMKSGDSRSPTGGMAARPRLVTLIEFPEAHHTLEFEAAGSPHLERMQEWLASLRRG